MAKEDIFVGREAELEAFRAVLERPEGEAVIVVGQAGMGKTWLVNRMARMAEEHPDLKCRWVRYEVTPTDSVDCTMALMMDNAFEAANTEPGSFDGVAQRRKQWIALLKTVMPKGGELAELIGSLRRDAVKNTREQFLERLRFISKRMPENGRAIFIIDPEKYMQERSDAAWALVVKGLPDKIKMVFAQRPEDVLVDSETFGALDNVVCIPEKRLDVLGEQAVDELLDRRAGGLDCSVTEVRRALGRYEGHPYALGAALDLLGAGTALEELPDRAEPVKFAEVQWRKVCKKGFDAIGLFEAYAILGVGVPKDVVEAVSGLKSARRWQLMADKYLGGLLREESYGKRIYHAILADHMLCQVEDAGIITDDIARGIGQLLGSTKGTLSLQILDKALGLLEERIRKDKYYNLLSDYISLASVLGESQQEGSTQRTYRYQSIGRILKDLGREEYKKYYADAAGEYNRQVSVRKKDFWRSESWFQVGWCFEHGGEWEAAAASYQKARDELRESSISWRRLLEAELMRCKGECLGKKLNEERGGDNRMVVMDGVGKAFIEAEKIFRKELGIGWTRMDILAKLIGTAGYTSEYQSEWEDKARQVREYMAKENEDCVEGNAVILCNVHDLYIADKIRGVLVGNRVWPERVDSEVFGQNRDDLLRSREWKYIVCLGGPTAKDGLFNWKVETFGAHPYFNLLLERGVGFFGCWLGEYEGYRVILLGGAGKYRTFLGVRDMTVEGWLDGLLKGEVSGELVWQREYDWI